MGISYSSSYWPSLAVTVPRHSTPNPCSLKSFLHTITTVLFTHVVSHLLASPPAILSKIPSSLLHHSIYPDNLTLNSNWDIVSSCQPPQNQPILRPVAPSQCPVPIALYIFLKFSSCTRFPTDYNLHEDRSILFILNHFQSVFSMGHDSGTGP